MNILKINTSPIFEICPRIELNVNDAHTIVLKSEFTQAIQTISASVLLLQNENYLLTLQSFPTGKAGEKFSYTIQNLANEIVSLGKLMIVSEFENIQDYSKKSNNKFYN